MNHYRLQASYFRSANFSQGLGWTNNQKEEKKADASGESKEEAKVESKEEAKVESKTEAKVETTELPTKLEVNGH